MTEQAAFRYWTSPLWDHLPRALQVQAFGTLYALGHVWVDECRRVKPVS